MSHSATYPTESQHCSEPVYVRCQARWSSLRPCALCTVCLACTGTTVQNSTSLHVPPVSVGLYTHKVPMTHHITYACRYNPSTGERRWTKPPMPAPSLPPGWAAAKDPNTGQKYYFNTATGRKALLHGLCCASNLDWVVTVRSFPCNCSAA